jgi:hypothetical protein
LRVNARLDWRLLSPRNVRALWRQSDPEWLSKHEFPLCTDEEWERFEEAMRGV